MVFFKKKWNGKCKWLNSQKDFKRGLRLKNRAPDLAGHERKK